MLRQTLALAARSFHRHWQSRLRLQYGVNSLLNFAKDRRLPLLKGTLSHIIFLVPTARVAR